MQRAFLCLAVLITLVAPLKADRFEVTKQDDGLTVNVNGKLFTRYLVKSGAKPVLWPVIGPTGAAMTRAYPMTDGSDDEKKDHIHHRSFWFTHGDINGISFWHEQGGNGNIVHREFTRVEGGDTAVITSRNDWLAPDGKKVCEDLRTLTFSATDDVRTVDFDITLKAAQDITIGDTKEGSFGVRVAGPMKVTSEKGGKITNSEGQTDLEAWGKPAAWVDYTGPVKGETVGVAILNHPKSFRYPTHWHVRTYGLFAANPFGLHDFSGRKKEINGAHKLKAGESITLNYRVLLHKGDTKQANLAKAFEAYAKENK